MLINKSTIKSDHIVKSQTAVKRFNLLSTDNSKKQHLSNIDSHISVRKRPIHIVPAIKTLVTNKHQECLLKYNDFCVYQIDSPKQKTKASNLIKSMYASRGYCTEPAADFFYNPNQISFEASIEQCVVGTITIVPDSKAGLLADALYKEELKNIRARDRKVYELTKLAINPKYSSKELLASLFNIAYINARVVHKATDFVVEVNPRHAGYYKRLLGFRQIGEMRICQRVNAPAVLLHLELDYVDAQVLRLAGIRNSKEKSIYTYFLTKENEGKVAKKIGNRQVEQKLYEKSPARPKFPTLSLCN